tara:strand:- start:2723 stop:2929 length:207 start_codon:yes stop_codon:yes gene_type:complete
MNKHNIKYYVFSLGICLLIVDNIISNNQMILSIIGFILLALGIYLISKEINKKSIYDPYAIKSYEEEE